MKLLSFVVSFLFFLCPFCADTFYRHYLNTVLSVQSKDFTVLNHFKLLAIICVYASLRMLYLFWGHLTPDQRLILYDLYFYLIKGEFNWMPVPLFVSCIYIAYKMYFAPSDTNNRLLLSIIEERDTSFFLYSKTENDQYIDQVIEAKMKLVFNLMQSVLAVVELTTIGSTIYLLVLFYLNIPCDDLPQFLLNLSVFFFSGIIFFLAVFYYLFLLSLIVSIAMAQLDTFLFKLKQLVAYLRRIESGQFQWFHYFAYRKALLSVLVPFAEYNHLYGQIFTVFLVCNCPMNAFYVITLLNPGDVSILGQMYMALYSCLQIFALFLIHLYLVGFSKRFHAPSYLLMRFYGQTLKTGKTRRQMGSFQVRLQIANSIEAWHTKRKYGLTYGPFGQVTLASFISFLLLYGKLLMSVYRRIYR